MNGVHEQEPGKSTGFALRTLFAALELDTSRWTYASTDDLRAVAVPTHRPDGRWDFTVYIQPNRPDAGTDIYLWSGKVRQVGVSGDIEKGGCLRLNGLETGCYHVEPTESSLRQQFNAALREASDDWRRVVNTGTTRSSGTLVTYPTTSRTRQASPTQVLAAPLGLAAKTEGKEIWRWRGQLLAAHGRRDANGDVSLWFESSDTRLDGARIRINLARPTFELRLARTRNAVVGTTTIRPTELADPGPARRPAFELPGEMEP